MDATSTTTPEPSCDPTRRLKPRQWHTVDDAGAASCETTTRAQSPCATTTKQARRPRATTTTRAQCPVPTTRAQGHRATTTMRAHGVLFRLPIHAFYGDCIDALMHIQHHVHIDEVYVSSTLAPPFSARLMFFRHPFHSFQVPSGRQPSPGLATRKPLRVWSVWRRQSGVRKKKRKKEVRVRILI